MTNKHCYTVRFESEGKPLKIKLTSDEEMELHDIRLELYNDYKDIKKLKLVDSYYKIIDEIKEEVI